MPQNWKTYKLSDFIDINPKLKLNRNEEHSFVEMKDLDPKNRTVLPSDYKALKGGAKFSNGDTLFARITPCLENGKICQVRGLKNNVGFGSTEFLVFRGIEDLSDSDFIYYLSREPFVRQFAENNMIGTSGRQRVAKEAFQNLELELPSLQEQRAIAQILSAIDDKIENNLAINKTLEEMAMALYKHWFVDFGPFQDGAFEESELGEIPEGWEVKRLDEILDIKYGKAHKKLAEGKYPVYGSGGIMRYVDQYLYDEESILIPRKGTLSNLFYLTEPFWSVDTMFYSIIKEEHFGKYTFHFLKTTDLAGMDVGSAIPSLTTELLNRINIIFPEINILQKFDETVNRYFNSIKANIEENQTLTKLRDTLLPKLISGEVRLKEFREAFEEVE